MVFLLVIFWVLPIEGADAKGASVATPMRASIGCDEGRFISPEECALAPSGLSAPRSLACELLEGYSNVCVHAV